MDFGRMNLGKLGVSGGGLPPLPAGFVFAVDDDGRFIVDDDDTYLILENQHG